MQPDGYAQQANRPDGARRRGGGSSAFLCQENLCNDFDTGRGWWLVVGYWLLVIGCWWLVAGRLPDAVVVDNES